MLNKEKDFSLMYFGFFIGLLILSSDIESILSGAWSLIIFGGIILECIIAGIVKWKNQ